MTMELIRVTKDFEAAVNGYNNCDSGRWKGKWWDIVEEIWYSSTEWAKTYVFDPVIKFVRKFSDLCKKVYTRMAGNYVYWIELINSKGEVVFSKIGETEKLFQRWKRILDENYCKQNDIVDYCYKAAWDCGKIHRKGLESYLRAMCIKEYGFEHHVPTDRFDCELDEEKMQKWVEKYLTAQEKYVILFTEKERKTKICLTRTRIKKQKRPRIKRTGQPSLLIRGRAPTKASVIMTAKKKKEI